MIKKLKLKFILNNMLLVGIVLMAIFSAFCLLVYFNEEAKISNALEKNILAVSDNSTQIAPLPSKYDDLVYDYSFVVFINNEGPGVVQSGHGLDEETLKRAIESALDFEYKRGNIRSLKLSFLKSDTPSGTIIAFISREHLDARINETIAHTALAAFLSLLLFLYISKRLADMAIAPVEAAWNQQKQFLADASHDLKTPLTVILANNNIISSHKDDSVASQMKWIESTSEEAGRMSDLVNKMLELAKGEEARDEMKMVEVNLSEVVENSILQFEVVAFERNIKIESGIQPNIIAKTHTPTFSKVLEILFDNAIKYSDENGTISITLYQTSKKVFFTINNHGEYIKKDELPHIFERFYRTNKEREVGGHGLGLSLARKKCDMIRAKISVESNKEDGTTFTVTLKGKKQ